MPFLTIQCWITSCLLLLLGDNYDDTREAIVAIWGVLKAPRRLIARSAHWLALLANVGTAGRCTIPQGYALST
jgi:hypothetical protein